MGPFTGKFSHTRALVHHGGIRFKNLAAIMCTRDKSERPHFARDRYNGWLLIWLSCARAPIAALAQ